jgi:hypothetical protein
VITLGNAPIGGLNTEPTNELVVMGGIAFAEPRPDQLFADGFY